ncbi:MAG: hypothetical protein U1E53_33735 [Dongiaceae bacterium]
MGRQATTALLAGALLLAAAGASATEQRLGGAEIQATLAGNSVHGTWGSTEYWSYFDPGGTTLYRTARGTEAGQWRVKGDQYCSVWPMSGESCYGLARDGDQLIWLTGEGKRYPSTVSSGMAAGF